MTKLDADNLLKKLANNMNARIVTWSNVDEAIEKDIDFVIIVNPDKYITEDEMEKINDRCYIGNK